MTLAWRPESLTAWVAEDGKYRYSLYLTAAGMYAGVIWRPGSPEPAFAAVYIARGAARADLEKRGATDYFVVPTNVDFKVDTLAPPAEAVLVQSPPDPPTAAPESAPAQPPVEEVGTDTPELPEGSVVTSPEQPRNHTVEVYRDNKGEYRWRRKAANHEIISDSSEGYTRKASCLHGLRIANQDGSYEIVDLTTKEKE